MKVILESPGRVIVQIKGDPNQPSEMDEAIMLDTHRNVVSQKLRVGSFLNHCPADWKPFQGTPNDETNIIHMIARIQSGEFNE